MPAKATELQALAEVVVRIDERTKVMDEKLDNACVALFGNGKPDDGLVFQVKEHHAKPHIHKWVGTKMFWTILFGGIITINVLVRFAWPWIVVIGKALGIPLPDEGLTF